MKDRFTLFLTCLALAGIVACKKKKDDTTPTTSAASASVETQFLTNYANIAFSSFTEAKTYAAALNTAINNFSTAPTAVNFEACKDAYKFARLAYLQCEVFRGVNGPIDSEDGAPESWINSWPLDEAYIDYVFSGDKNTDTNKVNGKMDGIINNPATYPDITSSVLLTANFQDGDANVATGFHAIEFLLWGQDIYAKSPGQRPYTDYLTDINATAPNASRRIEYLKVCAALLVDNLDLVVKQWDPTGSGNYRANLLNPTNTSSLLKTIVSGMTKMSKNEFGSQRIMNGLLTHEQEEEHSCFSDLTPMDFRYDVVGYDNVINGVHVLQTGTLAVSGTGLKDLIAKYSAQKSGNVVSALDSMNITSIQAYNLVTPYDQTIIRQDPDPDRTVEEEMANAWFKLSDALNLASQALGFGTVVIQ